jgi:hypothetical protein
MDFQIKSHIGAGVQALNAHVFQWTVDGLNRQLKRETLIVPDK